MLNITRLVAREAGGARGSGDPAAPRAGAPGAARAPAVVVWNTTRRCTLRCRHCYAAATVTPARDELTGAEGRALIADLARSGVRSLVLSGGEPLLRPDLLDLARAAAAAGLHVALSTGGTLLDAATARALATAGVEYVGVSIDGIGPRHDRIRGVPGAFGLALAGLRRARDAGLRSGLRFTLTRTTRPDLEPVLDLLEAERVDRGYVSHLVYVGRARRLSGEALGRREARDAVETVFRRAETWRARGVAAELVTGNNDADGVALYLRLRRRDGAAAARVRRRLAARGGNATGVAIASVDSRGDVHPDQFWAHATLGSVRERPFGAIWGDPGQPLLAALRDRRGRVGGRCAGCAHVALCGGGSRVRAEALLGDPWAADPGCHLTDAEIGVTSGRTGDEIENDGVRADDPAPRECAPAGP